MNPTIYALQLMPQQFFLSVFMWLQLHMMLEYPLSQSGTTYPPPQAIYITTTPLFKVKSVAYCILLKHEHTIRCSPYDRDVASPLQQ